MDEHNFIRSSPCWPQFSLNMTFWEILRVHLLLTCLLSSLFHLWEPWYCLSLALDSFRFSAVVCMNSSFTRIFAAFLDESRSLFVFLSVYVHRCDVCDLVETYNTCFYLYLLPEPIWDEAIAKMIHLLSALTPIQLAL